MDTFLFDLDGTLLPMDQDKFVEAYFKGIGQKFESFGMDPGKLIPAISKGTMAMINNDGTMSNRERFWNTVAVLIGGNLSEYEKIIYDFYENEFQMIKDVTKPASVVPECIGILKEKGYRIVLATNPLFPRIATYSRIRWAGLNPGDFEWITTYENSSYCKPNIRYYDEILNKLGMAPEQCIMVGNDVNEDMCAEIMGIDTYLITDCLINNGNRDIGRYKNGSLMDFYNYIKMLPGLSSAMAGARRSR